MELTTNTAVARHPRVPGRGVDAGIVVGIAACTALAVALRPDGLPVVAWAPGAGLATWLVMRQHDVRTGLLAMLAVLLANLVPDLLLGRGPLLSVLMSGGNTLEAAVTGYLFSRGRPAKLLRTGRDVGELALASLAGAALLGLASALVVAPIAGADPPCVAITVLLAHLSGNLLVLCLVLVTPEPSVRRHPRWLRLTTAALSAVTTVLTLLRPGDGVFVFVPLAILVGAAFVLSPRQIAAIALLNAALATTWAVRDDGSFDPRLIATSTLSSAAVQVYLICLICLATPLALAVRERERALEVERASRERLEEYVRLREDLLRSVTHELRTPLTTILGYSDVMLEGLVGELSPAQQETARIVRRNGERLLRLVDDVLHTASPTRTGTPVIEVDLLAVVRRGVADASPEADRVRLALPTGMPLIVRGDAAQLERAVAHLVANACQACEPQASIAVEVDSHGSEATVLVRDAGRGIDASEIAQVFDPFYRTRASRAAHAPGVGLGLTLVRRIIAEHHGSVEVRSGPDGTRMTVRLPLAPDRAAVDVGV